MLIKRFLDNFKSTNPFMQITFNLSLKNKIKEDAKTSYGWQLFDKMLNEGVYGKEKKSISENDYHPDNIIKLCDRLNISTFNELENWINKVDELNLATVLDVLNPAIILNTEDNKRVSYKKLEALLNDNLRLTDNFMLRCIDNNYNIPTLEQLVIIASKFPGKYQKYIPEKKDCDDFALMFKAFMSKNGLGNLTIFFTEVNQYDSDKNFIGAHALILAMIYIDVLDQYDFYYIEPQDDYNKLTHISEPYISRGKEIDLIIRFMM